MKKYSLKTIGMEHSLPVRVKGESDNRYVKFTKIAPSDEVALFDTDEKKLQAGIEASPFFENGDIELMFATDGAKEESADKGGDDDDKPEAREYPDVTTFKAAREVLAGEPYNIPATSNEISNADKVFAKAAELGIRFPNLQA